MAFTVQLFKFSKKENSTARPSASSATSFNCKLLKPSGVLNPAIELNLGANNYPDYNYAYIPAFNRYYWINEWTSDYPLWRCNMSVDVLASNKIDIGNSELYVLRSSATYDGNIIDTYYTSKTNTTNSKTTLTRPHNYNPKYLEGGYVIGVVSAPAGILGATAQYGSLMYYYIERDSLYTIVKYLTDITNWDKPLSEGGMGFNIDDASLELQKGLVDPLQYIKSCLWVPYEIQASITPSTIDIYGWKIDNIKAVPISNLIMVDSQPITVNIPKHPSTNSRGNYVNTSPYTKLWLDIAPYGVIELDTSITANIDSITLTEDLDLITGKAILTISGGNSIIDKQSTQLGVPIQLSQVSKDYIGMAKGALTATMGGVSAGAGLAMMSLSGGVLGGGQLASGLSGIVGGALDAYSASFPKSKSVGSGGGFVDIVQEWSLNSQFFIQTEDDNSHVGRPLYQNRVVNTLGGFILAKDGAISLPITDTELLQVRRFLESGFYYE